MRMRGLFFLLVAVLVVFAAELVADELVLTQNFGVADNPFMRIDTPTTDEEINPRSDQGESFELTPTGWQWGGYCDHGYSLEIDQNTRFRDDDINFEDPQVTDELIIKNYIVDSYAYTVFSSAGSNVPDTFIDLTGPDAALVLKISDIWDGWFGGGDNGSGLPGLAGEERATVLRAMVRDANGQWFASELFCPSVYETGTQSADPNLPSLSGNIVEYSYPLAGITWHAYSPTENTNLNALVGADEIALDRDPCVAAVDPDLSLVCGMGVYVWNAFESNLCQLAFTEISLIGETPAVADFDLVQNFSVPGDNYYGIDRESAGDEYVRRPAFDLTPTGWSWGGYCFDHAATESVEVDENSRGGVTFDELVFKNGAMNSYAYTIFDSTGGADADHFIDLRSTDAALNLKISDIWHGWFGDGDNGSGLPGLASEVRATVLRAMIRDANGKWYATDLFCPSTYEATPGNGLPSIDGTIVEYSFPLLGTTWYEYSQTENDNLNALQNYDEIALNSNPAVATVSPDLSAVSGMGIFVWNAYDTINGQLAFTEISLSGIDASPERWDTDELVTMLNDWLVNTISWDNDMSVDPVGNGWVYRDEVPVDYLMSGGKMVILGNAYGNWRIATAPQNNFHGTTVMNTVMRSTTTSSTEVGARSGLGLWLSVDTDQGTGDFGRLNYHVVLEPDNTQYVEFVSDWINGTKTASYFRVTGDGVTDFDNSFLSIELVVEPNVLTSKIDVEYTISDQAGTTANGSYSMTRRAASAEGQKMATILTGGAQGEIDSFYLQGPFTSPADTNGDYIINLTDFVWLAERWMTIRDIVWP